MDSEISERDEEEDRELETAFRCHIGPPISIFFFSLRFVFEANTMEIFPRHELETQIIN